MKYIKKYGTPIVVFVLLDSLIKIIIRTFYFNINYSIIDNIIRFHPVINTNLSWCGNYIKILRSPIIINLINIIVILIFISSYNYYRSKTKSSSMWINIIFITGMAGSVCSLIDKIFWGGSLDFIQIPNFFIFDLKDCYLTISAIIIFCLGMKHRKELNVRDYLKFCFQYRK